ncbi:hypothetical protein R1X32_10170 (plasmid) [Rhodococcus opacus]
MTRDVEKRWSDKSAFRSAATCAGAVIAVALAVMALTVVWAATGRRECADRGQSLLCPDPARMVPVFVPTAILLLGGLGAFVVAYRDWRRAGPGRSGTAPGGRCWCSC